MTNPISPQFVYVIHKDKERELMRELEMIRVAKERRVMESGDLEQKQNWYARVTQWMNVKLFNRASAQQQVISRQESLQDPCPSVPC